ALARALNSTWWIGHASANLAMARLQRDDLSRAAAVLTAAMPLDTLWERPPRDKPERRVAWAWGELALARGDPELALRIVTRLLDTAPGAPREQPIPALLKLRGEAFIALKRIDEAVFTLDEARRGAEARGDRPLLWQVWRSLGHAHQQCGDRDRARQDFAASREVIDALAATIDDGQLRRHFLNTALKSMPGFTGQPAFGLSPRELEVLRLVAEGLTDAEVAERLFVSRRTVSSHLTSAYNKLGVSTRMAATRRAVEHGII
ncbi:MAG: LuxR C-terminal-related transcriptional regulator, partial [Vicinamibacterales bacterium]